MRDKPRQPWIAGVLTFFAIGLGHLYCGKIKRAIILFFGGQLLLLAAFLSLLVYAPLGPIIAMAVGISYLVYCIADSVRAARACGTSYPMRKFNRWYVYLLYWLGAFLIFQVIEAAAVSNIAQTYRIPTGTMEPALQIGDHIIANKFIYRMSEPKRGDIIVFAAPEDPSVDLVKRVIALGGDTIEMIDKEVYLNGKPLHEPYAVHRDSKSYPNRIYLGMARRRDNFEPVRTLADAAFVLGDNRDYSY